ncbi:MAG: response regulator transcription factor [Mesorhizobium sp.]|nr:response regulator [Mesorhizobium sp.]MBL8575664.1 response regulator transcription factor [Mesorhizobium sp.]
MNNAQFRVYLVDDDAGVRTALSRVISIAGYDVQTFADAEAFLDQHDPEAPGCAVVDLSLPGKDGFEVQAAMASCGRPVVFLTGQGTIQTGVRAIKAGAVDFLEKPIEAATLLTTIEKARQVDCQSRSLLNERREFQERIERLTPRERQVLYKVAEGRLNKQIAGDLGTVEKTIKVHRARMMEKMGVRTVADLVRVVERFHQ